VFPALKRRAIVNRPAGTATRKNAPPLFETLEVLGKEKVLARIEQAIGNIGGLVAGGWWLGCSRLWFVTEQQAEPARTPVPEGPVTIARHFSGGSADRQSKCRRHG
jgi:hypothetical protein